MLIGEFSEIDHTLKVIIYIDGPKSAPVQNETPLFKTLDSGHKTVN